MPLDARYSLEVADVDIVTLSLVRGLADCYVLVGRPTEVNRASTKPGQSQVDLPANDRTAFQS